MLSTRRFRTAAIISLAGAITAGSHAAPLEPVSARATLGINGRSSLQYGEPARTLPSQFKAASSADWFFNSAAQLDQRVGVGNIPGYPETAFSAATSGAKMTQVAHNEYVIQLDSAAAGEVRRPPGSALGHGEFNAVSDVFLTAQLMILPAVQQPGEPATVKLTLEHDGTMTGTNGAKGFALAAVTVSGGGPGSLPTPFTYENRLELPAMPPYGFDDATFTGSRHFNTAATLNMMTGQTVNISTRMHSDVYGTLDRPEAFNVKAGDVNFASGLRLHLTVLPEPASLLLMGVGGILLKRRR